MATYAKKNGGSEFAKLNESEKNDLSRDAGLAMTDLIIDTSNFEGGEQITKIQEKMESKLQTMFEKRGHPDPVAAAKEAVSAMVGENPDKQRVKLQDMVAGANALYGSKTGGKGLVTLQQPSGNGGDEAAAKVRQSTAKIAERKGKFGGQEIGTMQSISDYFFEIAESGENFTLDGFMQAALKSIPDSEMRQKYAQEMTGGFTAVQKAMRDAAYTNKDIDAIGAGGDVKKIRELAGMTAKPGEKDYVTILDKAEMTKRRGTAVSGLDDKAVKEAYDKHIGDGAGLTKAQQLKELKAHTGFLSEVDSKLVQPGEMTMTQATQQAKDISTGAAKTDSDKLRIADLNKIQTSFFKGEAPDKIRAGVNAAIRQFGALDMDDAKTERLQNLILNQDAGAKEALQKELKDMKFSSKENRAEFTAIATAQQAGIPYQLSRAGFGPEADSQLVPTPHKPGEIPPPPPVATTAGAPAAAAAAGTAGAAAGSPAVDRYGTPTGKKQTTIEWLLGLPGTQDVQQKPEDKPVAPPAAAPGEVDTPEVAELKKEREAIQDPMTADDAFMAREEADYAAAKRKKNDPDAKDKPTSEELRIQKQAVVAQRVAKKAGLSVRGNYVHNRLIENGNLVLDEHRLGGKLLNHESMNEGLLDFEHGELQQDQFPETGETPYSPEAQKIIAVDEKIEQEKKKQAEQQAAAVKTANDQAIVQQSTGMSPADAAAYGEEPTGTTPPSAEQHIPPAKTAATPADQIAAKNDASLQQQAGLKPGEKPAAAAQKPPAKKYDVDPSEFKHSGSQKEGNYISIDGPFRDRRGKPIARPTKSEYFDAMHVVDRAKDDKQNRTGRVGQIGEKYYEQYRVAGGAGIEAWREVTVGKNEQGAQTAAPGTADSVPPTAAGAPDKAAPAVKQARRDKSKPAASDTDSWYASIAKKVAQVAGAALGTSVPDAKQVSGDAKNGVAAAQTTAITSRNVNPVTAGAGGEKTQKLTINGTLSLQGLTEAIINGRGAQPVAAEGAGSPIVVDPPTSPIDNLKPTTPG